MNIEAVAFLHRTQSNIIECVYKGQSCPIDGNHFYEEFVKVLPLNKSVALYPQSAIDELQQRIAELEAKLENVLEQASKQYRIRLAPSNR